MSLRESRDGKLAAKRDAQRPAVNARLLTSIRVLLCGPVQRGAGESVKQLSRCRSVTAWPGTAILTDEAGRAVDRIAASRRHRLARLGGGDLGRAAALFGADVRRLVVGQPIDIDDLVVGAAIDLARR